MTGRLKTVEGEVMHKQRDILPEGLREIVALAEDRFPGDIKKQP